MIFQASILRTSSSPVPASFLPAEQKPRANTVLHGAGLRRLASYRHGLLVLLCKAAAATTFGALGFQECLHCLPRSPLQALARKKGYNAFKARIAFQLAASSGQFGQSCSDPCADLLVVQDELFQLLPTCCNTSAVCVEYFDTGVPKLRQCAFWMLLASWNLLGSHGCRNLFNELEHKKRPSQVAAIKSKISCRFIPFPAVATFRQLSVENEGWRGCGE